MSNMDLANKLLDLKKEVKETEEEGIRLKAKLDSALENLGMTFDEAKEEMEKLKKKISTLEAEIEEDAEALEKEYDI
ncbi:MAG: hypothetical protein M0P71_17195 [Melioribacteraceae bacterium]|nr:hypothetical protein [Melioribacteraceae bacterium]